MIHYVYQMSDTRAICGATVPGDNPAEASTEYVDVQCPGCLHEVYMRDGRTAALHLKKQGYILDYENGQFIGIHKENELYGAYAVLDFDRFIIPEDIETCMKLVDNAPEPIVLQPTEAPTMSIYPGEKPYCGTITEKQYRQLQMVPVLIDRLKDAVIALTDPYCGEDGGDREAPTVSAIRKALQEFAKL